MTRIKICGIKRESQAVGAVEAGADFIGIIFASSPRRVDPARAKKIVEEVKSSGFKAETVGVFVNTPQADVNRIADFCGLDWVQLSGDETWEYCSRMERPVIKAIRMDGRTDVDAEIVKGTRFLSPKRLFLLDTRVAGRYGGTGIAFDWELAKPVALRLPVIVAGGITIDNVTDLIKTVSPWGVDVSSGVETDGVKDMDKVKALIGAVRRAESA